jgi:hypothetical protein
MGTIRPHHPIFSSIFQYPLSTVFYAYESRKMHLGRLNGNFCVLIGVKTLPTCAQTAPKFAKNAPELAGLKPQIAQIFTDKN